jgi:NAD(P)-dependent dehydrogenase (short-subunit alcohol dehydrogenase family)/dienelactone hydrolase
MARLDGKSALITGIGSGQGRAAALLFAKEGATVVGCDINEAGAKETVNLVRKAGFDMISMAPVDLSDEKQATAWIEEAASKADGIDVLYNNASTGRVGPLLTMTTETWHFTLRNELDLILFTTKAAWPHLVARGGGSVINTGSIIAERGTDMPMSAHGAAKAGVHALTVHMALEGGPDGIRVNTISPGLTESGATAAHLGDPFDNMQKQVRTSPLGRVGKPGDIAPLAVFLASDDAGYITGTNIVVDGGQSLGVGMSFGRAKPQGPGANPGEEIRIKTPDGEADAYLFKPDGNGPWPGVLLYTDIMGVRPVFRDMAQRLADAGFVVLLPNLFYRVARPFDPPLSVHNSSDFRQLLNMMTTLNRGLLETDSGAFLDALTKNSAVKKAPLGCVGYCMSGAMAMWTAGANPDRIGAVASIHGGHLSTGAPDSPDKLVAKTKAQFYFGLAETDPFMKPPMTASLEKRLTAAGLKFETEIFPGTFHGFAIKDASYNEAGGEQHWQSLTRFLKQALNGA